jgi:hypothetical protein
LERGKLALSTKRLDIVYLLDISATAIFLIANAEKYASPKREEGARRKVKVTNIFYTVEKAMRMNISGVQIANIFLVYDFVGDISPLRLFSLKKIKDLEKCTRILS